MAVPANTVQTYGIKGIREDLSDIIHNISPTDTPLYSKLKKGKAKNTYHEWQTDALGAAADNAHLEGDDTAATAASPTVRLGNYTQIFKKSAQVSGTADAVDKAGRDTEMGYQILKRTKELKLDIERALFLNQAKVAGSSSVARKLAGIPAWIKTNVEMGATGVNPTGDGSDARTDGTARALTQTLFDSVMEKVWTAGGEVDTCFLSPKQLKVAAGFVGNNNQRNTVKKAEVGNVIDIYATNFGTVHFQPSRYVRDKDVLILDTTMWAIAELRPAKQEPLAKTGDSEKRQIINELTLVAKNEAASGIVADCL